MRAEKHFLLRHTLGSIFSKISKVLTISKISKISKIFILLLNDGKYLFRIVHLSKPFAHRSILQ